MSFHLPTTALSLDACDIITSNAITKEVAPLIGVTLEPERSLNSVNPCHGGRIMKTTIRIAGLFTAVLNVGCVSYPMTIPDKCPDGSDPIAPKPAPETFKDYRLTPPTGGHWCLLEKDKDKGAVYAKNQHAGVTYEKAPGFSVAMNTMMLLSITLTPPKLAESLDDPEKIRQLIEEDVKRLETLSVAVKKFNIQRNTTRSDAVCFNVTYLRDGKLSYSNPKMELTQEERNLICLHPSRPVIVNVGVSERYMTHEPPKIKLSTQYKSEIDAYLNSLQFIQ